MYGENAAWRIKLAVASIARASLDGSDTAVEAIVDFPEERRPTSLYFNIKLYDMSAALSIDGRSYGRLK